MNRYKLKDILQSNYKREDWRNVLTFLSGNKNLLKSRLEPKQIQLTTQKASSIVRSLYELGTLETVDGITLPIFEIELQDNIKIEYNKVGVNQLIKEYILKDAGKGAIATYHYANDDKTEWRFSFISKFGGSEFFDEVEDVETNPKKYTYIFGTPEEHRTALERLYNLEQSRFRLEDFFEAFNVEPVSNNFFKEYKNFYLDFVSHLSSNEVCRKVFEAEKTEDVEKDIRNFVKRLLGRIVFLYFLQKKRWLGATNINYEDGDTNFLFNLFEADKEQFYTNWLSKLFFNALNTPDRFNDGFELPIKYFTNRSLKDPSFVRTNNNELSIPFLNGGLFEEHQEPKAHRTLKFPGFLFEELFAFFNGYNFTIYENSPEDHTVAVDPEMLGSIFENLLEDNKDKGAFYTPKEIVHFMTQESLIEHLNTYLNHLSKEQLESLVKNQVLDNIENADLIKIENLIDNVKVCDPAIGSGAFPMGLLQEIFSLKAFIHFALERPQSDWHPADIKQNIIQNSIYGVDLEEDAVDIARLRFWLSLVVDEEKPKPLPNLDYKIMQGNSLLESFEGIPLNNTNLFNAPSDRNITLFEEPKEDYGIGDDIKKLMDDYFNPKNYRKKQAIHKAIDKKVIDYIDKCLEGFENQKLIELAGAKQSLKRKTELQQKTQLILKEIEQIQEILNSKGNARKKLVEFEEKSARPYFLWHLFFKDVFEKGGFDIVIGNPPYVNIYSIDKSSKEDFSKLYKTAHKKYDLYVLFFEKSIELTKDNGIISLITSNKYFSQPYGFKLRELLLNYRFNHIVNFRFNIFNATVDTAITSIRKSDSNGDLLFKDITNKNEYDSLFDRRYDLLTIDSIESEKEKNFRLEITKKDRFILNVIEEKSKLLNDICYVNYGCRLVSKNKTKKKSDYIFSENPQGIYKDFIEGRDIRKYSILKSKYVDYKPDEHYLSLFEELFESGKIVSKDVVGKDGLQLAYDSKGLYNDHTVINAVKWSDLINVSYRNVKKEIPNKEIDLIREFSYPYLLGILNSKLVHFFFMKKHNIDLHFYPGVFQVMPIYKNNNKIIESITSMIISLKKLKYEIDETIKNEHIAHFFEEVIDGCVFELYFKEHMLEKGINIIALVRQEIDKVFDNIDFNELDEETKNQKIWELYKNLKNSEVQQRMRLFVAKSPDILKPILQS